MSIEYMYSGSGFAPNTLKMTPKANTVIKKGAAVVLEIGAGPALTGKIAPATGVNATAGFLIGICEEDVASSASPADVLVTLLSPDAILRVTSAGTTAVVAGMAFDLDATGENLDSTDSAIANAKVKVLGKWPGETKSNTTAGAAYMCMPYGVGNSI